MKNRTAQFKAFTLIELLVVISIISLLISILLPALGAARKRSQLLQCLTNHRTVGTAMLMYLNDFKDYFPPSVVAGASGLDGHTGYGIAKLRAYYAGPRDGGMWWSSSNQLLPAVSIERCPDNRLNTSSMTALGHSAVTRSSANLKWTVYIIPSKSPFIWESDFTKNGTYGHPDWWANRFEYSRHLKAENLWFLDGHASSDGELSPYTNVDKLYQLHKNFKYTF